MGAVMEKETVTKTKEKEVANAEQEQPKEKEVEKTVETVKEKETVATSDLENVLGSQFKDVQMENKMLKMHNVEVMLTIGKGSPTEKKIFLSDLAGKIKNEVGK